MNKIEEEPNTKSPMTAPRVPSNSINKNISQKASNPNREDDDDFGDTDVNALLG